MSRLLLRKVFIAVVLLLAVANIVVFAWIRYHVPTTGNVLDEALRAHREASTFPAADEDYFHDMDQNADNGALGRVALTTDEIKGRNTWIVWTAGNDRMWDQLSVTSFGALDLVKTISNCKTDASNKGCLRGEPVYNYRGNRWDYLGLANEPCYEASSQSDINYRWGLRVDRRKTTDECNKPDPFENVTKYPGVKVGARGKTLTWRKPGSSDPQKDVPFDAGSYYGYATGIVGLRLFPNPLFDQAAADKWDPDKYYNDPAYYNSSKLVKPYRVGMSCGFCHVGPNPIHPPDNPNEPKWENLSSNVGAQYFWVDRILYWRQRPADFAFQLFHSSRPGSLDTSFISTDNINNPRTMNAVYLLGPRLVEATRWGQERLAGGSLNNRQFNDTVNTGLLASFFKAPDTVWTPRVLKDGADSVGALGALNRVYLNIGTFSEEWLLHFNALVGGKPVTPIEIAVARRNSAYFAATEAQTLDMARFFLETTAPHHLKDAPGGGEILQRDAAQVPRGKEVFAENCARCHSSKIPQPPPSVHILEPGECTGKDYLKCWNAYWEWTQTDEFKQQMRGLVLADDFLKDNYLSSELRVPVTLLQTNACSPLATNAIGGNIWDNFSSQSYKGLPSVGDITWYHPLTGERMTYRMPAGGRGYTRPPSLVSVWSTAPFLLNNSVGKFNASPSVGARLDSFNDSIGQMLWPERRAQDKEIGKSVLIERNGEWVQGPSLIDRVGDRLPAGDYPNVDGKSASEADAFLTASTGFLPSFLQQFAGIAAQVSPGWYRDSTIRVGPIPKGTPIGLLSNLILLPETKEPADRNQHARKVAALVGDLLPLAAGKDREDAIRKRLQSKDFVNDLLALSKCPDLIVNRGHYFGANLEDVDKNALIAFLKTL